MVLWKGLKMEFNIQTDIVRATKETKLSVLLTSNTTAGKFPMITLSKSAIKKNLFVL